MNSRTSLSSSMAVSALSIAVLALVTACPPTPSAGPDSGANDAGATNDAGSDDAGVTDGGVDDAGASPDAGPGLSALSCVANGWALGRVRLHDASPLEILVTDTVPSTLPAVSGLVLLGIDAPASVVSAAAAAGVPVLRVDGGESDLARALDGKMARLDVNFNADFNDCLTHLLSVDGAVDDALAASVNARRGQSGLQPGLLLPTSRALCAQLAEGGDVVAAHRLKMRLDANVSARLLADDDALVADALHIEHPRDGVFETHDVVVVDQTRDNNVVTIHFDLDGNLAALSFAIFQRSFLATDAPFVALDEQAPSLTLTYVNPVDGISSDGVTVTIVPRDVDEAPLGPCPDDARPAEFQRLQELADMQLAVAVVGDVWLHPFPSGFSAGFTSSLVALEPWTVTNLTTAPFTLTSSWSRTYGPGHHNFSQNLALEPRLEAQLTPTPELNAAVAELNGRDVAGAVLIQFPPAVLFIGADGHLRQAP